MKFLPAESAGFIQSFALSSEAENVQRSLAGVFAKMRNVESLHARPVRELQNTFFEAKEENWDGYQGKPVTEETYRRATAFLEKVLEHLPAPSSGATPDGSLSFEWYLAPRRRLMVSIGEENEIAYAALFGSASVHGTETFHGDIPMGVSQQLNRLFPAQAPAWASHF